MKLLKFFLFAVPGYFIFCLCGTGFSGCTKVNTVHDTTTVIVKDTVTLTVRDTTVINDTIMSNITNGLVAYYNFNGGNLNDSSGHSNNIVFNSATLTSDRFGNPNNAFLFDGVSSYMRITNSASLNPNKITMYAIVKPLGFFQLTCHGNQILSKGYPYNINGFYQLNFFPPANDAGGGVCSPTVDTTRESFSGGYGDDIPQGADAGAPGTGSSDSVAIQKNQWYTVVYTYDGNVANFYVNGALTSSIPNVTPVTFTPNVLDLLIGKHENPSYPYYFKGVIDEIRIYNRAINNQEVGYLDLFRSKYLKSSKKTMY